MFQKLNFHLFGREITMLLRVAKERSVYHYGIGNRCKDGKYVLFLDYDETPIAWIREEVRLLQEDDRLGTAYLFKTKHGHHIIFLEKLTLGEVITFMEKTSVDKNFRDVPMAYGRKVWVLRQSHKKDESIIVYDAMPANKKEQRRERSKAHALFLKERYNIPLLHLGGKFDNEESLVLAWYRISEVND